MNISKEAGKADRMCSKEVAVPKLFRSILKANGIMGIGPSSLDREYILDKIFKDLRPRHRPRVGQAYTESEAQCLI